MDLLFPSDSFLITGATFGEAGLPSEMVTFCVNRKSLMNVFCADRLIEDINMISNTAYLFFMSLLSATKLQRIYHNGQ
jgi:hypothetical protein